MGIDTGWNDSMSYRGFIYPITYGNGSLVTPGDYGWNGVQYKDYSDSIKLEDMCCKSITVSCKDEKNDIFITIVNSLRENLNSIRAEEIRVRQKALKDKVDAEPSVIEVEALKTKYNSLGNELYKLEDYQFIKASRIKKARKALLEQAKEIAGKVVGFNYTGSDIDYVAYYLRRVFEKKEDVEIGVPKYYTTDEIKARLYLTENWEELTFDELLKKFA